MNQDQRVTRMKTNKGYIDQTIVFVLAIFVIVGILGTWLIHSITTKNDPSAATIIDGASSDSPTVDHFVRIDGALNVTGTTTVAKSPDGFVAYAAFTVATGTAKAVYTNTNGPMVCNATGGMVYSVGSTFAPTIAIALGTTTSASGYATNLMSSTTLATTSTNVTGFTYTKPFYVNSGQSIVASISDINSNSSSTYFTNWNLQFSVPCWSTGS